MLGPSGHTLSRHVYMGLGFGVVYFFYTCIERSSRSRVQGLRIHIRIYVYAYKLTVTVQILVVLTTYMGLRAVTRMFLEVQVCVINVFNP